MSRLVKIINIGEKMKIIGLVGSYRKNGNTDTAVKKVLDGAKKQGADVELLYLKDFEIKDCVGCEGCRKTYKCIIKDDMEKLYEKLMNSDGLVLGSPTYFYNVTGIIKNFIDRLYCYEVFDDENRSVWMSVYEAIGIKYATVVAICEQKSPEDLGFTAITMTKSLQALGYRVVDELKVFNVYEKKELESDKNQLIDLMDAGQRLAKTIMLKNKILKVLNS